MATINNVEVRPLNKITVQITAETEKQGATLFYQLSNDVDNFTSFGSIIVSEEFYLTHGTDKQYILNFVIEQLNLTIIQQWQS